MIRNLTGILTTKLQKVHVNWNIFEIVILLVTLHLVNYLVRKELIYSSIFSQHINNFIIRIEYVVNIVFLVVLIMVVLFWKFHKIDLLQKSLVIYLSMVTLQLAMNVFLLVVEAHAQKGKPLYMLWDVASIYIMNILLFALWYWFADKSISGGAFVFPFTNETDKKVDPHFMDYLFISFNTSTTFGPTSETVISKRAKAIMMVQTTISLVITIVLAARAVGGY